MAWTLLFFSQMKVEIYYLDFMDTIYLFNHALFFGSLVANQTNGSMIVFFPICRRKCKHDPIHKQFA
jgi:hypothetical protein